MNVAIRYLVLSTILQNLYSNVGTIKRIDLGMYSFEYVISLFRDIKLFLEFSCQIRQT